MPLIVECKCGQHYETPEYSAGRRTGCPECGRELTVPHAAPSDETLYIAGVPGPPVTSGRAAASLWLGALLFFGALSGVPAILLGSAALGDIRRSGGRLGGTRRAIAGIVLGVVGCLLTVAVFVPVQQSSREAARRAQCVNNLKQIGLALHQYHAAYGCFPPAASTDKAGRPLLSWRVAILPFMDSARRRMEIHLDEPWDSPHNLALLNDMPSVYQCPSDRDRPIGMTNYQVIVGPNTAFPSDFQPVAIADITDGSSQTIALGESRRSVPWTKPDDLPFDLALSASGLGSHHGYHNNGFNALLADGSVRFLRNTMEPSMFRAVLTRNGGEVIAAGCY